LGPDLLVGAKLLQIRLLNFLCCEWTGFVANGK